MKYTVTIKFKGNKNCLECPIYYTDACNLQIDDSGELSKFGTWEEQMKDCPLKIEHARRMGKEG